MPVLEGEMLIKFLWNREVVTHPIKNVAVLQELNSNTHTLTWIKQVFLQDYILEI